jgi:hypothetical protein
MNLLRCALAVCAFVIASNTCASAEWRPPDLAPTTATQSQVLATYARTAGTVDPRFAERRERWTYVNGSRRLPVDVTVRGTDFRAALALGTAQYSSGRADGVRWRADGNGITHATLSDDQGDALDRLPQSVFPFSAGDCALAGESSRFGAAWVLLDRAPRDKEHWFYVDKATGRITREVTREGGRTIVTVFDAFDGVTGAQRPRHWRVNDGDAANDVDVTVDAVAPEPLSVFDVAIPQARRTFTAVGAAADGILRLPARFTRDRIYVDVDVDGGHAEFILDTGTASITLDPSAARKRHWEPVLEHVTVPMMRIGALQLSDVSTLAIPFGQGILGYDFFLGHVVHIDYGRSVVEVLTPEAAAPAFTSGANVVIGAYVDEGMPLVHAAFGPADGDRFALDTGSPSLYVMAPFARRHAAEIAAHWIPASFGRGVGVTSRESYAEGSIVVSARRAASFALGRWDFRDQVVGVQQDGNTSPDALDMPFDGIIGTDHMRLFDWWFDYDGGRIAMRRNSLR